MRCRINKGAEQVFAPNGNESLLFKKLYAITNDFQSALDTYALSETEGYKEYKDMLTFKNGSYVDTNGELNLEPFMGYVNSIGETTATQEDVIKVMESAQIESSEDLLESLGRIEVKGIPVFSVERLRSTGLFGVYEAELISKTKAHQDNLKQVLKYLRQNEDFEIGLSTQITTGTQLPSGKNETETDLPDDTLIDVGTKGFETRYTLTPLYNQSLSEDIGFLTSGVTVQSWFTLPSQITAVLENIEEKALDVGIDVVGLAENYYKRSMDDVLDMVDAIDAVLSEDITPEQFDLVKQEFFDNGLKQENRTINQETDVIIKENLTEDEAFEQGMLKVAEDAFRRIPNVSYETLLVIQAENENVTVEAMERIVNNSYDRGLLNGKHIYLFKRNQNIGDYKQIPNTSKLERFSTDLTYLTDEFIKDFAKVADRRYFNIDFKGITFVDNFGKEKALATLDAENLYLLEQYSLLSPYIDMPYEVESFNPSPETMITRAQYLTNPSLADEYKGNVTYTEDTIAIKNLTDDFIRHNGVLHELVNREGNVSFYKEVTSLNKPVMEANVYDFTALVTEPKATTQHKVRNIKEEKENNFNC